MDQGHTTKKDERSEYARYAAVGIKTTTTRSSRTPCSAAGDRIDDEEDLLGSSNLTSPRQAQVASHAQSARGFDDDELIYIDACWTQGKF
jgi:hypothetical protein